jgi:hypothetical protein
MHSPRTLGATSELLADEDGAKAERAMKAMLAMKKIDIARLKKAAASRARPAR